MQLTNQSLDLFKRLAEDSFHWSGCPLVDFDNDQDKGNYTDLKKKGLVTTHESDGTEFCLFTEEGLKFAQENDIEICETL